MKSLAPISWAAVGSGLLAAGLYAAGQIGRPVEPAVTQANADAAPLALDADARARAGVKVMALTGTSVATPVQGFAKAVDLAPLALIEADRVGAVAAAGASQAEASRLAQLYAADQSASRKSVEAARAQAIADNARVTLARRRVALEFGPGLARLGASGWRQLIDEAARGDAALVRIDVAGVRLLSGQSVQLSDGPAETSVRVLGATSSADPKLQTAGVFAIVRGSFARDLASGRIVAARVPGGPVKRGVLVPRSAIVRWQGARWVYRQKGNGFERVELTDSEALADGWLVRDALSVGDKVAVEGGASLLAAEHGTAGEGD